MKKLCALIPLLLLLLLPGCGSGDSDIEYSGATQNIEILLDTNNILTMKVPAELSVVKTDNHYYWEFSNDITIFRTVTKTSVGSYDEAYDLYAGNNTLTRNFDNCSVTVSANKGDLDLFRPYLSGASLGTKSASIPESSLIASLPSYKSVSMALRGNLYMPAETEGDFYTIYDAELYTFNNVWLQSWIMDAKIDAVKEHILTLAVINTNASSLSACYESDDIVYYATDTTIIAAKKLAMNSWYIYYGPTEMSDYILSGLEVVHG